MNSADPHGGLLLQSIAFRQANGRERDNEKRHQPVVGEAFAEHVDNAGLSCLTKERQSGRQSGNQRRRDNNKSRTKTESESNQDNRNPTQL
jgi:hypothetical protein